MDLFAARRDKVLASLRDEGVQSFLVSQPLNVTYLTGFTGDSSYLYLSPSKTLLISDGRYTTQLAEECPRLEAHIRAPGTTLVEAAAQVLEKLGPRTIGYESNHLTVAEFQALADKYKTADWKPGGQRVEKLRQVKDATELVAIRQAIRFAEKAFVTFQALLRPEASEKELADDLELYVRRAGGKCTAFPSIIAVGDRAALPHYLPGPKRIVEAPMVLVDWGANGPLYKSDLTRVLFTHKNATFSGKVDEARLRRVHGVVLEAQKQAIAAVRPGVKGGEVDGAARKVISDAGLGEHFTHSIGHGFGLQIHEAPLMKPASEVVLEAGMVVTIEPGVYLPGEFGIRIEDDVLVTPDGHEVLTHLPKDFEACTVEF